MTRSIDVLGYIKATVPGVEKTKALKLLYYSQGWSLAWNGAKIFPEKLEAWQYGPVERDSYYRFEQVEASGAGLDESTKRIVDAVIEHYSRFSSSALSAMTHDESPWREAYYAPDGGHLRGKKISETAMKREYTSQSIRGEGPRRPVGDMTSASAAAVEELLTKASIDWRETLDLLAAR